MTKFKQRIAGLPMKEWRVMQNSSTGEKASRREKSKIAKKIAFLMNQKTELFVN
ncbi:MAG: hypothetical protein V7K24_33260 [Nostoc sp.]